MLYLTTLSYAVLKHIKEIEEVVLFSDLANHCLVKMQKDYLTVASISDFVGRFIVNQKFEV